MPLNKETKLKCVCKYDAISPVSIVVVSFGKKTK